MAKRLWKEEPTMMAWIQPSFEWSFRSALCAQRDDGTVFRVTMVLKLTNVAILREEYPVVMNAVSAVIVKALQYLQTFLDDNCRCTPEEPFCPLHKEAFVVEVTLG